jgi:S1-C subfamily serine protease
MKKRRVRSQRIWFFIFAGFLAGTDFGFAVEGSAAGFGSVREPARSVSVVAGGGWAGPRLGEAFDDRELVEYFEACARGLWEGGKLTELKCLDQGVELDLPAVRRLPRGSADRVDRAESATVVFGAIQRVEKKVEKGGSKSVDKGLDKRRVIFGTAGGGFFVTGSGVCVTCWHVVSDKGIKGMVVLTRDGGVFPVKKVLASDPVEDVAVVQVELPEGIQVPVLEVADWHVPVGGAVFVMSHPDERFYMLTTGVVSRHTLWREKNGASHFMSVTADFAKGSSGCPVMDETGAVVGVVNNTESIYYDDDGRKKQTDLQMVVKNVTPVSAVRSLFKSRILGKSEADSPLHADE